MSTVYLSETAHPLLQKYLKEQGYQIRIIRGSHRTYWPVSSHPDIYMCSLGPGRSIFFGDPSEIGFSYPENIPYNAACTGRYIIHNFRYTCPTLLEAANDMIPVQVSQGYTKCNVMVVDETSVITSDRGIIRACHKKLDVLPVEPGHILLQDFSCGFIGGASGRIGNRIVFNGNLELHPDFAAITRFIQKRGLEPVYFRQYPLEDIGSILENPMD